MGIEKIEYLVDIVSLQIGILPATIIEIIYDYDEVNFKMEFACGENNGGLDYFFDERGVERK